MNDQLGKRMKENYEMRSRTFLPRRTYTIIRLDGKSFHTFTKGLDKPVDSAFVCAMDETAKFLCQNIQGAIFAYVQSDEISILLTDFEKDTTDAWFDGQVQKITSVSASMATHKFNDMVRMFINDHQQDKWNDNKGKPKFGLFDSRVFTISDPTELENYFIWRQKDAIRNSLSMMAQHNFSHKDLHGKSQVDMHEMLNNKDLNWDNMPGGFKYGRLISKKSLIDIESTLNTDDIVFSRPHWEIENSFDFIKEREGLIFLIPTYK